jgi:hypothetical protein
LTALAHRPTVGTYSAPLENNLPYHVFVMPHAGGWRVSLCEGITPAPEATLDFVGQEEAEAHALDLGATLAQKPISVKVIRADHGATLVTLWASETDLLQ